MYFLTFDSLLFKNNIFRLFATMMTIFATREVEIFPLMLYRKIVFGRKAQKARGGDGLIN
jgi:hypothetical protein